jgi:hypothetical protein
MAVIPILERQKDQEYEVSLGYEARPYLKNNITLAFMRRGEKKNPKPNQLTNKNTPNSQTL